MIIKRTMTKMTRVFLPVMLLALISASCASLSKTQIKAVNDFAKVTKDFSNYPSAVTKELAEIRYDRSLFYAGTIQESDERMNELNETLDQKVWELEHADSVDITFKIIDKYAQILDFLSSDKFENDLKDESQLLGISLDSLIKINNNIRANRQVPEGIGRAVAEFILFIGKNYTRWKQAKEVKYFVTKADTLIEVMTANLIRFLESDIINEHIINEEKRTEKDYQKFVKARYNLNQVVSRDDDLKYLSLKKRLAAIKELRDKSTSATKKLRTAHIKLLKEIQNKRKLKEVIKEISALYEEVNEIKQILTTIKSEK